MGHGACCLYYMGRLHISFNKHEQGPQRQACRSFISSNVYLETVVVAELSNSLLVSSSGCNALFNRTPVTLVSAQTVRTTVTAPGKASR